MPNTWLLQRDMAERTGFEPVVPCGTPVFKTGAINHSATSPAPILGYSQHASLAAAAADMIGTDGSTLGHGAGA
jgi:hypothetical protein